MPASPHLLFDTARVSAGRWGKVWFLGGASVSSAGPTRTAPTPGGTALFFPIVNSEFDNFGPPPTSLTEQQLRDGAKAQIDAATQLFAKIDGVAVANLGPFRVQSPLFTEVLPADNLYGVPAGSTSPMRIDE